MVKTRYVVRLRSRVYADCVSLIFLWTILNFLSCGSLHKKGKYFKLWIYRNEIRLKSANNGRSIFCIEWFGVQINYVPVVAILMQSSIYFVQWVANYSLFWPVDGKLVIILQNHPKFSVILYTLHHHLELLWWKSGKPNVEAQETGSGTTFTSILLIHHKVHCNWELIYLNWNLYKEDT